jgi:hypothetical protein
MWLDCTIHATKSCAPCCPCYGVPPVVSWWPASLPPGGRSSPHTQVRLQQRWALQACCCMMYLTAWVCKRHAKHVVKINAHVPVRRLRGGGVAVAADGQLRPRCQAATTRPPATNCAARNNGKASTARQIVDAQLRKRRPRPHTEAARCRHSIRCAGRGTSGGQAAVRADPSIKVCMHPNPPPLSASAPEPPLPTTSCEPC